MDDIKPPKRPKIQVPAAQTPTSKKAKAKSDFIPPDEIESSPQPPVQPKQPLLVARNKRFSFSLPKNKKQWLILAGTVLLIIGSLAAWLILKSDPKKAEPSPQAAVKKEPPKPTTEASKLSGLTAPIGVNERQVLAVMIENSPDSRPQSGLKESPVVFEAIAEGGITRFVALYQDTEPAHIGPIRSVRQYYLDWILPFDAAIAHVGGSPKGLSDIKSLSVKDLDQFANSGAYERVSSRYAPHNVYSSFTKLNDLAKSKNFIKSDFTGFLRKAEQPLATPMAKTIDLNISSYYYNVRYDYDSASNTYLRSQGGSAHKDEKSGTQVAPKVVIAVVMDRGIDSDGQHTNYTTVGSGKLFLFQDGYVSEGNWTKSSRQAQWKFTDPNGKDLALNPGQTWITMVDKAGSVTYK